MQMREDEERLAELFSQAARIPRSKIDTAMESNSITEILAMTGLLAPTREELKRIYCLLEFKNLYVMLDKATAKYKMKTPEAVFNYLQPMMGDLAHEQVVALMLDTRFQLIKRVILAEGAGNSACIDTSKLARAALLYNARTVILAHNHPSAVTDPSREDIVTTRHLALALNLVGIDVGDHVIVGKNGFTSFKATPDLRDALNPLKSHTEEYITQERTTNESHIFTGVAEDGFPAGQTVLHCSSARRGR